MSQDATDAASALRHLYLIDGSGFVFRAFHALPPLTRPDGTPVNAVLGFTNMLWKILRETDADHAAVIFDTARRTFRNDIFEPYKANRGETPEELIPQFPLVREAAGAFNLASVELDGFEADDLIAAYTEAAQARGARVTIVSADKDLMQLVAGESVVMYDYFKSREIGPEQVTERFGVGPERVIDVQALAGDSTDNVPGVPGIGVKTAAQLINDYGDLDRLLERAEEIKQPKRRQNLIEHAEMARLSRTLVTLRRDAPLPLPLEALARRQPEPGALRAFFQENGFRSISARLEAEDGEATLPDEEAEPEETAPLPASYHARDRRASARRLGGRRRVRAVCWRWSRSWRTARRKAAASSASRSRRRRGMPATCRSATRARTCWIHPRRSRNSASTRRSAFSNRCSPTRASSSLPSTSSAPCAC